jgi:hypothetical protein
MEDYEGIDEALAGDDLPGGYKYDDSLVPDAFKHEHTPDLNSLDMGDDDFDFSRFDEPDESGGMPTWAIFLVVISALICLYCFLSRDAILRAWHRRQATRAAAAMHDRNAELMPVSSLLGTTQPVKVIIEMDGVTHTIGASLHDVESVSRVPFALTDACVDSGFPELSSIDLVDLVLSKRAGVSCEDSSGKRRPLEGSMSAADLAQTKVIHVTVQPKAGEVVATV